MSARVARRACAALLAILLVAGPGTVGAGAQANPDAEEIFAAYLEAVESEEPLAGPRDGTIEHDPDTVFFDLAGVDVRDFVAHAEFTNPYAADEGAFDIGFGFRYQNGETQLRLIVDSEGGWYLDFSVDRLDRGSVDGLRVREGQRNKIDLVAAGDTGYFGLNGDFVAELDLSSFDESGDVAVATAFLLGNDQPGAETEYEEFTVWELPEDLPGEATTDEEPSEDEPAEEPTADTSIYESPTYGYALEYDESWEADQESSEDGFDSVRLVDEVNTVYLYGFESDMTPEECVEGRFELYAESEGYFEVEPAVDEDGEEVRGEVEGGAFGVVTFTYEFEDGEEIDFTAYVECRELEPGVSLLELLHIAPTEAYEDQIERRESLLEGLFLPGSDAEPDEEETEEPEPDAERVVVQLEPAGRADVNGLATIEAGGNRTDVRLLVTGDDVDADTVAVIQEGTCDDLSGEPVAELEPIEAGVSETSVRVSLDDLLADAHVISIHVSDEDFTEALACGEIEA